MEYSENGERAAIHSVIPMSPSKHFRDPIDLAPRQLISHISTVFWKLNPLCDSPGIRRDIISMYIIAKGELLVLPRVRFLLYRDA